MSRLLVLGTADWNQAIATNQHVMVRELARENEIIYTESMGLRQPEVRMRDIKRALRRLNPRAGLESMSSSRRPVPAGVDVRTPKVIPRHVGLAYRINAPRVERMVADWMVQTAPKTLWTYTPVTYGLESVADVTIYHCVDLLGAVEGIDAALIEAAERRLAAAGAQAIGSSEVVVAHLEKLGFRNVLHWPNVADTEVIESARPDVVARGERRAVFAGNLSTSKVDFNLLRALIDDGVDLHLAGPIAEGGGSASAEVRSLVSAGATYHGVLELRELAKLYWTARVGLIPYVLNDYTRGVNPLKTYEYLAAGLGVVSTAVPAVTARAGHVGVAARPEEFCLLVRQLSVGSEDERIAIARDHTWSGRGVEARELVVGGPAAPQPALPQRILDES